MLTVAAPTPKGIYSQGIVGHGPFVHVAGQGPVDPRSGRIIGRTFTEQAHRTFRNVGAILRAAGSSWGQAVKTSVFLADLKDFAEMNRVYRHYVRAPYPARTTVQAGLMGILIEVDCVALAPVRGPGRGSAGSRSRRSPRR